MRLQKRERDKRNELVAIANAMLSGETDLIEGVRDICSLRFAVGDPQDDAFMFFIAADSETDHFPVGQQRKLCADEYLQRVDREMQRYLADAREDMMTACRNIVSVFSRED
ncbi:MAG: DUF2489 domain-containing protein [candidate division Zixibacteria bacterium]|nr:DUF2489 domain-containing protein [candidate division Zixibacteria bacterium]